MNDLSPYSYSLNKKSRYYLTTIFFTLPSEYFTICIPFCTALSAYSFHMLLNPTINNGPFSCYSQHNILYLSYQFSYKELF